MVTNVSKSNVRIEAGGGGTIEHHELPADLIDLIDEYDARVGERDRYLWKWIHHALPDVTLSSVPPACRSEVVDAKLVASMFVVLLDDIGEKRQDRATLTEASKIPFATESPVTDRAEVDSQTIEVAETIWRRFERMIGEGPRREEFADVFEFDLKQTLNAIEYSSLVNENLAMANGDESWAYDCHNMMLFTYSNTDLMFSPTFDRADLGTVRRAVNRTQKLARIGNWITTWERELREGDFTSGVVVHALENGIVTNDELYHLRESGGEREVARIVERIRAQGIEEHFLDEWAAIRREVGAFEPEIDSIDLGSYLEGMETLLHLHIASRGKK